ncbi:MAG: prepilin-type N-terminal cleavage/methylation domain-containing protein [Bacilli bacterium]|nr:prepilin-type N-terminal cleavage/methylation domain-containing protein [Bacilli bacterium]
MKKGYTLVELLAVIILLSIILGLVSINAIHYFNERKEKDYENIKALIVDNSKVLVNSTSKNITKTVDYNLQHYGICKINVSDLVNYGLMDTETNNPLTNESMSNTYVKVTIDDSSYDYVYEYIDQSDEIGIINCLEPISE